LAVTSGQPWPNVCGIATNAALRGASDGCLNTEIASRLAVNSEYVGGGASAVVIFVERDDMREFLEKKGSRKRSQTS
jgi:hypothetical protein